MWDMRRSLRRDALPDQRVVLRFDFTDVEGPRRRWWLLAGGGDADICMTDPGFEVDLHVSATLHGLTSYWVGRSTWSALTRCGQLALDGPRWIQRALPEWLGRSSFAAVRPA